jgi:hypothetical protein
MCVCVCAAAPNARDGTEEMRERPTVYGPNAERVYFFWLAADVNGVWRAHAHLDRQIITECDDESIFHVHGWATSVVGGYLGILTPELDAIRTTC